MIQKPQVLSTRLLCLADGPRARALANQQESKARLKLGISLELCSAQHSKLICLTGTNRHFWEKGECYPPDCFHRAKRKVKAGLIYYRGGETWILGSIGKGRGFFIISNVAIFFSTRLQSTFPPLQFYTASFQPTVLYGSKHEHLCLQMVLLIMLGLPSQKVLIPKEKKKRKQSITHIPICAVKLLTFKHFCLNEILAEDTWNLSQTSRFAGSTLLRELDKPHFVNNEQNLLTLRQGRAVFTLIQNGDCLFFKHLFENRALNARAPQCRQGLRSPPGEPPPPRPARGKRCPKCGLA